MRVEAFEEGGDVAGEGVAGGELEVRAYDVPEGFEGGAEVRPLVIGDSVLGVNATTFCGGKLVIPWLASFRLVCVCAFCRLGFTHYFQLGSLICGWLQGPMAAMD